MHAPLRWSVYGLVGLAGFGVAYDSGSFGPPDGFDHSAVVTVTVATSSVTLSGGVLSLTNNITGDGIAVPPPARTKLTQV
jgi:hypothetical protein